MDGGQCVGMGEVLTFPPKVETPENLRVIPDVPANHEREGQGPPIGTTAWCCIGCGSFAFYATRASWHCYECHREQRF